MKFVCVVCLVLAMFDCLGFDLQAKRAFVCDLDGTLFVGDRPIRSAVDYVIANSKSGRFRFYYLTNNTSKRPQDYMQKLLRAGIPVKADQILTPLVTLEEYIREKEYRSVYLVASAKVTRYLEVRLADVGTVFEYNPKKNELIALTFDRELTYDKLANAARLWNMHNGGNPIDYVMTHPDNFCPSEDGPIPDIGGMARLLETTNGMKPSRIFGKPSPSLLRPVLKNYRPDEVAVVGDRLYTDKAVADNAKVDFVCVLSGETTVDGLKDYKGTYPAVVVDTFDKIESP